MRIDYRKEIRLIYPNAICIEDTPTNPYYSPLGFVIINDTTDTLKHKHEDILKIDAIGITRNFYLGVWRDTSDDAWKNAHEIMRKTFENRLAE
jgi:hypothetical protein